MTCMHCAGNVKKAVESFEGASDVEVILNENKVEFLLDDPQNMDQVKERIKAAGYEA